MKLGDDFLEYISSEKTRAINLNDPMAWFSYDAMGLVTYGEDFGMVRARKTKKELADQQGALSMMAPINDAIWIARLGMACFPFLKPMRHWFESVKFCCDRMEKRMHVSFGLNKLLTLGFLLFFTKIANKNGHVKTKVDGVDMATFFLEEYYSHEKEESVEVRRSLLMGSAMTAMFAGSDTTRAALVSVWYFLCKYPHHAEQTYEELRYIDTTDANVLAALPHFNGVIKKTLRLAPPTLSGGKRQTGPGGLFVDGTFIPAGVQIFASKYVTHRRKSIYCLSRRIN